MLEEVNMQLETEAKERGDSILHVPLSVVHVIEQEDDAMDLDATIKVPPAKTFSAEATASPRQEGPTFPNALTVKVSGNHLFIERLPSDAPWSEDQRGRVSDLIYRALRLLNQPGGSYIGLWDANYHELLLEHPITSFTVTASPLWIFLRSEFEAQPPLMPSTMLLKQLLVAQDAVAASLTHSVLAYGGDLKSPLVDIQRHMKSVQDSFAYWRKELFTWYLDCFTALRNDELKALIWEEGSGKARPLESVPEPLCSMLAQEMYALMKQYTLRLIHLYEAVMLNLLGWPQKLHEMGPWPGPRSPPRVRPSIGPLCLSPCNPGSRSQVHLWQQLQPCFLQLPQRGDATSRWQGRLQGSFSPSPSPSVPH